MSTILLSVSLFTVLRSVILPNVNLMNAAAPSLSPLKPIDSCSNFFRHLFLFWGLHYKTFYGTPLQWLAPNLARKYWTRMEVTASGKHSCLLQYGYNYSRKTFYSTGPASTFQAILKFCNLAQAEVLKLFVVATAKANAQA